MVSVYLSYINTAYVAMKRQTSQLLTWFHWIYHLPTKAEVAVTLTSSRFFTELTGTINASNAEGISKLMLLQCDAYSLQFSLYCSWFYLKTFITFIIPVLILLYLWYFSSTLLGFFTVSLQRGQTLHCNIWCCCNFVPLCTCILRLG